MGSEFVNAWKAQPKPPGPGTTHLSTYHARGFWPISDYLNGDYSSAGDIHKRDSSFQFLPSTNTTQMYPVFSLLLQERGEPYSLASILADQNLRSCGNVNSVHLCPGQKMNEGRGSQAGHLM